MSNKKHIFTIAFLLIIIITGLIGTWFIWNYIRNKLSDEALEQARIIARSIDVEDLKKLSGNYEDLKIYEYHNIKKKLQFIRKGHSNCRFLYLMGIKNDKKIFFFLDSQPEGSKDAVVPGLIYKEVSEEYKTVFNNGKEQTVGPIEDRWGRLVTSLIPIYEDGNSKNMIAVLGMDINVDDWYSMIFSQIIFPIGATVFILILIILLFMMNKNKKDLKKASNEKANAIKELEATLEQVKELKGILPICAQCKNIRDDEGYWNKIEEYISKNTDAHFSHGICPECTKALYPEFYAKKYK